MLDALELYLDGFDSFASFLCHDMGCSEDYSLPDQGAHSLLVLFVFDFRGPVHQFGVVLVLVSISVINIDGFDFAEVEVGVSFGGFDLGSFVVLFV